MTAIIKYAPVLALGMLLLAVAPNPAQADCSSDYDACVDSCSNDVQVCEWVTMYICTVATVAGGGPLTGVVCTGVSVLVCEAVESSCESDCEEAHEECEDYENSGCS